MKRLFKSVAMAGWRMTGPVRRPLARKCDGAMRGIVSEVVDRVISTRLRAHLDGEVFPRLDGIRHGIEVARHEAGALAVESNLTLDSVVRELGRLQMQIEALQWLVADLAPGEGSTEERLSLVADGSFEGDYPNARSKVG